MIITFLIALFLSNTQGYSCNHVKYSLSEYSGYNLYQSIPFFKPTDICSFSNYGVFGEYSSSADYCIHNNTGYFIEHKAWHSSINCSGNPTYSSISKCDAINCVCNSSQSNCKLMTFTSKCNSNLNDTSKYVYKYLANECIVDGSNYYKLICDNLIGNGYQIMKYSDNKCSSLYVANDYYDFQYVTIPIKKCVENGFITATCSASSYSQNNNDNKNNSNENGWNGDEGDTIHPNGNHVIGQLFKNIIVIIIVVICVGTCIAWKYNRRRTKKIRERVNSVQFRQLIENNNRASIVKQSEITDDIIKVEPITVIDTDNKEMPLTQA